MVYESPMCSFTLPDIVFFSLCNETTDLCTINHVAQISALHDCVLNASAKLGEDLNSEVRLFFLNMFE